MILLVEDNEDDIFIMQRVLKKLGQPELLQLAVDGRQALDFLQDVVKCSDPTAYPIPSVIFLDLKLPIVHGFQVLDWIRQQPSLAKVPVAILTSSSEPSDREEARRLGATTFLVKPPTPEMIGDILNS